MNRRDLLRLAASTPFALSAQPARYSATWESIDRRPSPSWYTDARFGIFIHWGVYSVPSYAAVNAKGQNPYAET